MITGNHHLNLFINQFKIKLAMKLNTQLNFFLFVQKSCFHPMEKRHFHSVIKKITLSNANVNYAYLIVITITSFSRSLIIRIESFCLKKLSGKITRGVLA